MFVLTACSSLPSWILKKTMHITQIKKTTTNKHLALGVFQDLELFVSSFKFVFEISLISLSLTI